MEYAIEMNNITKRFGNLYANNNVTFKLRKNEIHALLGENGAGKSTLMSILFGLYQADSGEIKINGQVVNITNPNVANQYKVGMVHQHFKLVPIFTVLENIALGREDKKAGFIDLDKTRQKVKKLIDTYHLEVDLDAKIKDITVGQAQRVEILKMLYRDAEILIFDEPTAVLTPQEIDSLMQIMRNLIREGKSIVFITHKLNEIKAIADRCSIMRKGEMIDCVEVKDYTKEQLSKLMVGRDVNFHLEKNTTVSEEVMLEVKNLNYHTKDRHVLKNINFDIKKGEVVCVAGIDGNGQSELAFALGGLIKTSGKILLNSQDLNKMSIRKRNLNGLSYVPEDRHRHGLVLDYDMAYNLVLKDYFKTSYNSFSFLNFKKIYQHARQQIQKFDIRSANNEYSIVRNMSGGNQQKVILAREISLNNDLILLVQPTRGLDVGAIEYIHRQILKQREEGKAVLLISFELDEVMALADRILVMYEGEIVAKVLAKDTNVTQLGLYMSGAQRGEEYER